MTDFSVIGLGSVGWAVIHGLHSRGYSYSAYDIKGKYDWQSVLDAPLAFICTSTPAGDSGHLDAGSVEDVLSRLNASRYGGIVVVKSTIPVGFMDRAVSRYPKLSLVYMPEFLRERSSFTWFENPDRIVVAGKEKDCIKTLNYFSWATDARVIKTDYTSAEIGKLAHNAYIATKVSFTNEMEAICRTSAGNPNDVMKIVWTDRRVNCKEHLTPGLGPYGGKCVLKDVNELIEYSGSNLLASVREVNYHCPTPETRIDYPPVHVLIPALDRPALLDRALYSVNSQSYSPASVIVITDPELKDKKEIHDVIEKHSRNMPMKRITNERTKCVSGAINTGLYHLSDKSTIDNRSFVAILDDDDWWERRYLENCVKYAGETGADWIATGLIRHIEQYPDGLMQNIPSSISISDFLVGNPNIQNSNLFIRSAVLASIGGYDESLVSTTDRDTCIRLLQNKNRYAILFNHLVHHDAYERPDRLSTPGSSRKATGMSTFFSKYSGIMNQEEKLRFKKRARELFSVELLEG